jgi:Mu-like prophage I protein
MKTLISAAMASAVATGAAPRSIVYIPEGSHQITATVNGKPGTVTVNVPPSRGAEIAAKLQAALMLRMDDNVIPIIGFDHKPGASAARPQTLRYEPGKGIMLDVDWTGSGRAAIEGKDYAYFSPTFYRAEDGTPESLPAKGEIGSLVNNPAFRNIQRIAASDASFLDSGDPTEILEGLARNLVSAGQARSLDDALGMVCCAHPEIYASVTCGAAIKPETREAIEEMKEKLKRSDRPKDRLDVIAKQLRDSGEANGHGDSFYLACIRNPELYQEHMEFSDENIENLIEKERQKTGLSPAQIANAEALEMRALPLILSGGASNIDEAIGLVFASDPSAYSEYLATLS